MRLKVIAVGRLKNGPERDLVDRYQERFADMSRKLGFRGLEVHEMADEAAAIMALIPDDAVTIALDERGKPLDSEGFAKRLGQWRDESMANVVFVIGGADGLSPELRRRMKAVFAFGTATWPHQLVRIMLMEQIYRAATILAGHPYHRA
jgi:23S rRNA (pseudouridine1915-N3)-methyltransferase